MALPVWLVPALIATSTAVSFMGSLHQSRNMVNAMKRDKRNAENRSNQIREYLAKKGRKQVSAIRAAQAASQTQISAGSNLLQQLDKYNEIATIQFYASKNLLQELDEIDTRGSALIAKEMFQAGTNLLGGGARFFAAGKESELFS